MSGMKEELHKGEKVDKEFGIHPLAYILVYLTGGVFLYGALTFSFPSVVIGVLIIGIGEMIRRGHKFYITNQRVIYTYNFLSRKSISVLYGKIQDIQYTQNVIERMFGLGKVHVNTAGSNLVEIIFNGVQNPSGIKKMISHHMMKK